MYKSFGTTVQKLDGWTTLSVSFIADGGLFFGDYLGLFYNVLGWCCARNGRIWLRSGWGCSDRMYCHRSGCFHSDDHTRGGSQHRPFLASANTFLWLYGDTPVWGEKHTAIKPILIGLEHLRSLKWACWSERLSDKKVEDIFWNNAAKLFNIGASAANCC